MPSPMNQNGFDARLDNFGEINAIALENALDQILPPVTKSATVEVQTQSATSTFGSSSVSLLDAGTETTGLPALFGDVASSEDTFNDEIDLLEDIVDRIVTMVNEEAAVLAQNESGIVSTFDLGGSASLQPEEPNLLESLTRLDYDF